MKNRVNWLQRLLAWLNPLQLLLVLIWAWDFGGDFVYWYDVKMRANPRMREEERHYPTVWG